MRTIDIEIAVALYFNCRVNIIVPNISWGLGIHECDLLIISKAGYASEVEIKTSLADLKQDKDKRHKHDSKKLKYLYFAIPDQLLKHIHHIPERAGIIVVHDNGYSHSVEIVREPKLHSKYKFTQKEMIHVLHLGCMRIWGLKKTINARQSTFL